VIFLTKLENKFVELNVNALTIDKCKIGVYCLKF